MKFENLSLSEPLLRSLQAVGYEEATPIQAETIPQVLEGRDVIGCAQTGTGKTAAFALPTIQLLNTPSAEPTGAAQRRRKTGRRVIRGLILAPTRELAGQIGSSLKTYGKFTGLRNTVIYGGVKQGAQVRALKAGIDILVATPGRLLDLIGQGYIKLDSVEILILDEADQMLDMGFIHDLRKIVSETPAERQTLMFSATMPPEIRKLTKQWLRRPYEVEVATVVSTPDRVSQSVYFVQRNQKAATLTQFLRQTRRSRTLVFSRTKRGADKIAKGLQRDGIRAVSIHGGKTQAKRDAVMRDFKSKRPPVLVATDLAARGLDFSDISHVINFDLPDTPEVYVHRIGRTARAGASGEAVSFCAQDERKQLRSIERLTGQAVPVEEIAGVSNKQQTNHETPNSGHSKATTTASHGEGASQSDSAHLKKFRARRKSGAPSGRPSTTSGAARRRRLGKAARAKQKGAPRVASGQ